MRALSMYSGGCDGMSLAASWCGIETVAFCDSDEACRAVLAARHPDKTFFRSDEEVTTDALRAAGIAPDSIDIVFGGPPCQCASVAGKRLGDADPRNRWPQFLRVVRQLRPRWVLAENVPGLLSANNGRLFGDILRQLAEAGYVAGWQCWRASDVGAPHARERLFIMAHTYCVGSGSRRAESTGFIGSTEPYRSGSMRGALAHANGQRQLQPQGDKPKGGRWTGYGDQLAHAKSAECQQLGGTWDGRTRLANCDTRGNYCGRPAQPRLGGNPPRVSDWMDDVARRLETQQWPHPRIKDGPSPQYDWEPPRVAQGIPDRATRLKMIGNACPPQQYLPAFFAIKAMDEMMYAR